MMTIEELRGARARLWRQDGQPLATGEDAAAWLQEAGLALLRPRTREVPAPAPTLAEALGGAADPEPGLARIEQARQMLPRMDAVPLLLLGGPRGSGPGSDEPDFLASREAFPFVYALRGDRDWQRGPRGKGSPLEAAAWTLLGERGAAAAGLTAGALKDALGKQVTEAAALRALGALWSALRVEPVWSPSGSGGETLWRRTEQERADAMGEGAAMGQPAALSALISLYLQTAVAAAGEEVEAFLAPLASRARVREALRALTAARQLGVRALGAREHFFVEGSLPDFQAAAAPPEPAAKRPADVVVEGEDAGAFRIEAVEVELERRPAASAAGRPFFAREPWREDAPSRASARPERPRGGSADRRPFGEKARGGFLAPSAGRSPGRPQWDRGSRPDAGEARGGAERPGTAGERRAFPPREGKDQRAFSPGRNARAEGKERRAFPPPEGEDRPGFGPGRSARAGGGERRAFTPRGEDAGRPPVAGFGSRPPRREDDRRGQGGFSQPRRGQAEPPGGGAPREAEAGRRFGAGRPSKPWQARPGAGKPFGGERPASSGEKPRGQAGRPAFPGARPFQAEAKGRTSGGRPWSPGRKSFGSGERNTAEAGEPRPARSYAPRGEAGGAGSKGQAEFTGGPKTPGARGGFGERRAFRPKPEGGFRDERGPGPRRTGNAKSAGGMEAPPRRFGAGQGGRPAGKKPRTAPFTSTGKPRPGVGKPGRPGPKAGRKPFGKGPRRDGPAR